MPVPTNPEHQGFYPQTKADIVRSWKESLRYLGEQEDTIVAGYITTDVGTSDYWNKEIYPTNDEKDGDEEFIYIYELAHDLEVPGGSKEEREADWQRLKDSIKKLEEKYLSKE